MKTKMTCVRLSLVLLMLVLLPVLASAEVAPQKSTQKSIDDLPLAGRYAISASMGRDNPVYHSRNAAGQITVNNPAQSYRMAFSSKGVAVHSGPSPWGLSLESWGYGQDQELVPAAEPQGTANRVEYRRGPLTEWYVNGPYGLQQGFTLESRPRGDTPVGPSLRLYLNLQGGLTARVDPDRRGLSLSRAEGAVFYRYSGLTVLDADGRAAAAWLEVQDDRLAIVVDDHGLRYPLTIDPVIQKAKLTAADGATEDYFGQSVSISGDTVVVGAYGDDDSGSSSGSAYVFVKSSGGWANMTQTAKLTAADGAAGDYFGKSVSASGDVVVVGASRDKVDNGSTSGSAYVFVKPSGGWTTMTQTAKLTAADGEGVDAFGYSVSISGDTVVVGAYGDDDSGTDSGSAYVFVKPSEGWSDMTQTAKLTAADGATEDYFGQSVSISGDVAVVGASWDGDNGPLSGSAYVFVKPSEGWANMTQTAKLTASDGWHYRMFGRSVSISGDMVMVGAPDIKYTTSGLAYVFVKPSGGWTNMTQTAKLRPSDGAAGDFFGQSVAVSGDTGVIGAWQDDDNGTYSGSAYVFQGYLYSPPVKTRPFLPFLPVLLDD